MKRPTGMGTGKHWLVIGALALATPAAAQTVQNRTVHLIEWDLPANMDASPGAMVVDTRGEDNNRLWFITRLGNQKVYQLNPAKSLMKGSAQWTSWDLAEDSFSTGGAKKLKASHDRRFVFVRTATSLQRIDTQHCDSASPQTCERIEWLDQIDPTSCGPDLVGCQPISPNVSDLSVDDYYSIFTTSSVGGSLDNSVAPDLTQSYVQMLVPGTVPGNGGLGTATVTRWTVGGGAGFCADIGHTTTSFPCISGIAALPSNRNLIYYSEPEGTDGNGNIAELNISTNVVRRWPLSALLPDENGAVQQPRQLFIDRWGIIWVITGSGHLVSLDPCANRLTKHAIPNGMISDPFGLAPDDDMIGYTDAGVSTARVGMMFPTGQSVYVTPSSSPAPRNTVTINVMGERSTVGTGSVAPNGFVVPATITTKPDGIYVEAMVGSNGGHDSESPLGITANRGKAEGTFFYAVGLPGSGADRVGFVRLPMVKKPKHPRDDDDDDDGGNDHDNPGWHNSDPNDDDDDGVPNDYDTPTANENASIGDPTPLAPGQSVDYPLVASPTTLALIASATADNVLGSITVDIYDAFGHLVAGTVSIPGAAAATLPLPAPGTYTARVKNVGLTPWNQTPTLVVREPWLP